MDLFVLHLLSRVAARFRRVRLAWLLSSIWIGLALVVLLLAYGGALPTLQTWLSNRGNVLWVGLAFIGGLIGLWTACQFTYRDTHWIAARIEDRYPSLNQRLLTVAQPTQPGESVYLRRSLIKETIQHGRVNDWKLTVSSTRMAVAWFSQFAALSLASTIAIVAFAKPNSLGLNSNTSVLPSSTTEPIQVEPGSIEIERGSDVVVTVRFPGFIPEAANLDAIDNLGGTTRTTLQRNLNDAVFGGYLRNVQQDFDYKVEYGQEPFPLGHSETYQVQVFDYPSLVRADATIDPPIYANQERRVVKDTRTVTVPEGTTLQWTCTLNKPVVTAELVDRDGKVVPLLASTSDLLQYTASIEMNETKRWKLRLIDDKNRTTKFDETLSAKVLLNKPPETKLVRAQDVSVSPLQEVTLQATAQDDFGIHASGLTFVLSDAQPIDIVFANKEATQKKISLSQMIDMESLHAKPDQLLSYYFWVEDLDRNGNVRRVDGEMFFAEVRPYDEIFREGESPSGESKPTEPSQSAQKAEELAELQKQIISGTWNVVRNTQAQKHLNQFSEDLKVLSESQSDALTQADALEEEIRDPQSLKYLEQVREAMTIAIKQLNDSKQSADMNLLREALQSERKAYEGLLRLRAREHEIVRSQQQSQSQSSQSASQKNRQQQIDQLKLDEEQNRYETEQQAAEAEPAADRETRQVMNRLEELARRQKDLNEQLKEIETALQEAQSQNDQDKAKELEEELKRLRENQDELLRDSDELLDRMDQAQQQQAQQSQDTQSQESTSQQAMQKAREQMEQARSELQKSAESLSQGQTAPAISSGTRAERQMEETRDELRKSSANQLEQTMRSLLQNAQELETQQKKLQKQMNAPESTKELNADQSESQNDNSTATPLRPEGTSEDPSQGTDSTREQWLKQQEKLNKLLEQMQETVTEAESSEPLLAEELYESFRESKQKGIAQGMEQVPTLLDRGLEEPAKQIGNKVAEGVRELRESIQQASEKVVGSEQESLRRALGEIESAKRQIEQEANRNDPNSPNPEPSALAAGDAQQPQSAAASAESEGRNNSKSSAQPDGESSDAPPAANADGSGRRSSSTTGRQSTGGQPSGQGSSGQPSGGGSGIGQITRGAAESSPLMGDDFSKWTDAIRDVEELVSDPEMKADAARIREAAREMRIDYARHSKEPQWPLVRRLIVQPLDQLQERVQEALLRSSAERNAIVPVDRDPLPSNYQQQLDQYYENLGSGQKR